VGETARARSIYEIAVAQPELDMPELLWKAYIDFEMVEKEVENVRALYDRLLERTQHVKVMTVVSSDCNVSNVVESLYSSLTVHCCTASIPHLKGIIATL
jgi:hypothetical protein